MDSEEKWFCYQKAEGFTHYRVWKYSQVSWLYLTESEGLTKVRFILVLINITQNYFNFSNIPWLEVEIWWCVCKQVV